MSWDDIAGQEDAKRVVMELVVWPMQNPALFTVRCHSGWGFRTRAPDPGSGSEDG